MREADKGVEGSASFANNFCKPIILMPRMIRELVADALGMDISYARNLPSRYLGNVQARLGGVISPKKHEEIVSRADVLIAEM